MATPPPSKEVKPATPPAPSTPAPAAAKPSDFISLLKKRDPLAASILLFNTQPADYVHPGFLPEPLGTTAAALIRTSPRARRRISRTLLEASHLTDPPCLDFQPLERRLALLAPAQLQNLLRYTGATLLWPHIARIITGKELRELKAALNAEAPDLHSFALLRAPFLFPSPSGASGAPDFWSADVTPETLLKAPVATLAQSARLCLQDALSGEPPALLGRLRLKLPPKESWQFPATSTGGRKKTASTLLQRLLQRELQLPL